MGDLLFIGSCNGVLHGVDRRTGEVRWTYDATRDGGKPEFHGRPLVTSELIVIASDDRRPEGVGYVYAFDRATLAQVWKYPAGAGVMTDVLKFRGTAYVVTLRDEVVALDLRTGAMRWSFASGASNESFFPNATPAVVGDRVIFGGLNGTIYALKAQSGTVLWRRHLGARISTSIAAVGGDLYAGDATGRMHWLDAATGASKAQLRIAGNVSSKLVPTDKALLVFASEAGATVLKSIPATLQTVRWTRGAPPPGWSSFAWPYVWNGWVVVGRETGEFVGLRLSDGEPGWEGKIKGSIAGIGGDNTSLYLGTTQGTLYGYTLPAKAR